MAGREGRKGNNVEEEPRHRAIVLVREASPEVVAWLREQAARLEAAPETVRDLWVRRLV